MAISRDILIGMDPKTTQLLDLHIRLEPALARRLRQFATASERTLGGCVRLLVRDGLDRLDETTATTRLGRGEAEED
jgi:hypothetical protein